MTKADRAEDDDVLYGGTWLTVRAMQRSNGQLPALSWYRALDGRELGAFRAAATNVENSWRARRPGIVRTARIPRSSQGLTQLRVTLPAAKPPHLRAMFLRDEQVMWLTHGFSTQKKILDLAEIELGDSIAADWLQQRSAS